MGATSTPRTPRARSPVRAGTPLKYVQNGVIKTQFPSIKELEAKAETENTVSLYSSVRRLKGLYSILCLTY